MKPMIVIMSKQMRRQKLFINSINFICLALPVVISAVSILLLLLFNLNDRKMEEIRKTLAEKTGN